jgi:hypothetical protein
VDREEKVVLLTLVALAMLFFVLVAGSLYATKLEHEEQMLTLELLSGSCQPPAQW